MAVEYAYEFKSSIIKFPRTVGDMLKSAKIFMYEACGIHGSVICTQTVGARDR